MEKKKILSSTVKMTLLSILLGLIITAIILLAAGYNPLEIYAVIVKGVFSKPKYISYTIIRATPLILTGISVAFAFKTGLFNIGAEGQFIIGTIVASMAGYFFNLPIVIHPIVVMILAIVFGGLYGSIIGLLKAKFGIHEVITSIMLNWIALYAHNAVINIPGFFARTNKAHPIKESASIVFLDRFKNSDSGKEWLINHQAIRDILKSPVNYGIIIAIIVAVVIWFILNKTTLGYRLRAVGYNKFAAEYGGINVKRNIVTSMFISGSVSGLAGALMIMGVSKGITTLSAMEGYGLDGIGVALIAGNSPISCIFSGIFFGALKYGGTKIQAKPIEAPKEIINIMIGTIIFFVAIPRIVNVFRRIRDRKGVTE
ncbi:ABC transporter permease [Vallitalea longa]|uniref:ABC transporter permease n=1 Tax=Vallitalea longa TaxID=2936439 RepID=A0A9W6DEM1_9FIRM|nr:ABC transporter permease [Vallitalea longa]GKX30331.1 ABC transporter permease [Vallitalea longa]